MTKMDECTWTRKWAAFNSFDVECQASVKMYAGKHAVAVPPQGARYCCWCGKTIAFKEPEARAIRALLSPTTEGKP